MDSMLKDIRLKLSDLCLKLGFDGSLNAKRLFSECIALDLGERQSEFLASLDFIVLCQEQLESEIPLDEVRVAELIEAFELCIDISSAYPVGVNKRKDNCSKIDKSIVQKSVGNNITISTKQAELNSYIFTLSESITYIEQNGSGATLAAVKKYGALVDSGVSFEFFGFEVLDVKKRASCIRGAIKRASRGEKTGKCSNNSLARYRLI